MFFTAYIFAYQDISPASGSENASVDYLRREWIVDERNVLASKGIEKNTFTSHSLSLEPGGQVQLLWAVV